MLGKRELILVLFVRLFDLCLFGFEGFPILLVSGKGCGHDEQAIRNCLSLTAIGRVILAGIQVNVTNGRSKQKRDLNEM